MWDFFYAPDRWATGAYQSIEAWGINIGLSSFTVQFLVMALVAVILLALVFPNVMFMTWLERKVAGHIQSRLGPTRTGPFGLLQPVADAIKAMSKQPLALPGVDGFIYFISPMVVFTMALLIFIVIPYSPGWVIANLDVGLLFVFAVSGVGTFFVLAGGWCSNNKWSLLGGMRAASQVVSYEVPLIISTLGVALLAGSLNLAEIVQSQSGMWNIVRQFPAFLVFLTAAAAEINRAPFDLEEAEQEIVAGYLTEYAGMRFALFYLSEYVHLLATAALITVLFLGGWYGPVLPPVVWFGLKTYAVIFLYMWIRWTYPRIRVDHLMQFCWKFVLPVALINLVVTSLILVL